MAKNQKGFGSAVKITLDKPKITAKEKGKKVAPGNPEKLNRGNRYHKRDVNGCSDREALFVEYLTIHWNKGKAVLQAGFECVNSTSYANELLGRPHIKTLVEKRRKEFRDQTHEIRDQLTSSLSKSAFYDYNDFFTVEEVPVGASKTKTKMVVRLKPGAMERGAGELINSVKIGQNGSIEFKLDDKNHARQLLAEHIGYKELDNLQKRSDNSVGIYIPDNGRGDVVDSNDEEKES